MPEANRVVGTAHPTDAARPRLKADQEEVIALIGNVVTVSVETTKVVEQMKEG